MRLLSIARKRFQFSQGPTEMEALGWCFSKDLTFGRVRVGLGRRSGGVGRRR
jgi:hypothetical protein